MLKTIIQKNNYQDSIVLMLLTNKISTLEGVNNVSIMMGTPANKDIFKTSGLYTEELEQATPNDIAIVLDVDSEERVATVLEEMTQFLADNAKGNQAQEESMTIVKTWDQALIKANEANVALISIPGTHAALEIERALDEGYHVFCFSDNVSVEDEQRLKAKAHAANLLLMGPDCGTGIINGIPLAFTNAVRRGRIGVIGASGTGIQEVTTLVHQYGEGVTHAIGTGGRDLKDSIGGVTLLDSIDVLAVDPEVEVIVVISKPASPVVREQVLNKLRTLNKPVVTLFLGDEPTEHEEGLYHAYTLEEVAKLAVKILHKEEISDMPILEEVTVSSTVPEGTIKGYYSGGTLAAEAAMLVTKALGLTKQSAPEGYMLQTDGHEIIDLGDDIYTQGKPHPMIDPDKRIEMLQSVVQDESVAVVLLDVVLGYGSHDNMAEALAPTLRGLLDVAKIQGRELKIIATIVGTDQDPQDIHQQQRILQEAGVLIADSNAQAVQMALTSIGKPLVLPTKTIVPKLQGQATTHHEVKTLLTTKSFLNIGLRSFAQSIVDTGAQAVQFDWKPVAGGNITLQKALQYLRNYKEV